jgi:hypothetical protein
VSLNAAYCSVLSLTVPTSYSCTDHFFARSKSASVHCRCFTSLSSHLIHFDLKSQLE